MDGEKYRSVMAEVEDVVGTGVVVGVVYWRCLK